MAASSRISRPKHCYDDAFEGQYSYQCILPDDSYTITWCTPVAYPLVAHPSNISFHYKSNKNGALFFSCDSGSVNGELSDGNNEWKYAEKRVPSRFGSVCWEIMVPVSQAQGDTLIAKIDNICFPPTHRPILNAGNDLISCEEDAVELLDAYAYDCNSIYWVTNGDGVFEDNTLVNTLYLPGSQDLENGEVTLSLYAIGNDTLVGTKRIHFVDEISLGQIMGESVVNKYANPVSQYAVERQDGARYLWQLEPANAGYIYGNSNEVDILWNQHEDDTEASLSVTIENSCMTQPMTKHISLIGYSIPEWHSADFELFPNPTDGKVNLVVNEAPHGKAIIEVYNLLGERMMSKSTGCMQKGETYTLDLSHLISGLYIIKLSTENGSCSKKVSVR